MLCDRHSTLGSWVKRLEKVVKIWNGIVFCKHSPTVTEFHNKNNVYFLAAIEKASLISGKRVEQYMSSKEWLERHGLEARKLTAYQELANCSFRHVDGVVDLKGKPGPNNQFSDAVR